MSLLARRIAGRGTGVLLVDLCGTGESWGDFAQARYETWLSDLAACREWIQSRNARLTMVVGLRLGALLAADFAQSSPSISKIILWQPVISGEVFLSQFLRLRVAANLMTEKAGTETVTTLRQSLQSEHSLEVAGYELAYDLTRSIDQLRLGNMSPPAGTSVHWLQLSATGDPQLNPPSAKCIEELQSSGATAENRFIHGEAFWSAAEITVSTELLDATESIVFD